MTEGTPLSGKQFPDWHDLGRTGRGCGRYSALLVQLDKKSAGGKCGLSAEETDQGIIALSRFRVRAQC